MLLLSNQIDFAEAFVREMVLLPNRMAFSFEMMEMAIWRFGNLCIILLLTIEI